MRVQINKGFTLVENLIALAITSIMLVASVQLFVVGQKVNKVIEKSIQQRETILGLQQVLTKEISKASFFYSSETSGIPSTSTSDPTSISDRDTNATNDPYINKIAGYDSGYNTFYGDNLHYISSEFVDANTIVGGDSSSIKSIYPLGLLDGSEKIFVRVLTDNFLYPRQKSGSPTLELVLRQYRYAVQVIPIPSNTSLNYVFGEINNVSMTQAQQDLALNNLTYRLCLNGYALWKERSSASATFVDQTDISTLYTLPTVTITPQPPKPVKRVIAINISADPTYDNASTPTLLTKKGIAFKILRPNTAVVASSVPSQKDLNIKGVEIIISSKQFNNTNDKLNLTTRDVFTIRTLNNRIL